MNADEYLTDAANAMPVQSSTARGSAWAGLAVDQLLKSTLQNAGAAILLSDADADAYQRIFTAQRHANWREANARLAGLSDRRLVGHVLVQRFLHPTGYRAEYGELRAWLKKYADLPDADRIHSLALRRQPVDSKAGPNAPMINAGLKGGLPEAALQANTGSLLWSDGLAAWQRRDYGPALVRFHALARDRAASGAERAAGAFWAARALTRLDQPEKVNALLQEAARYPRTFYGLIAARQLGRDSRLNWDLPDLAAAQLIALNRHPAGHRAIALLQIGQIELAQDELRGLHPRGDDAAEAGLVALATLAGMPNLAFRVATAVTTPQGRLYDAALYPMPAWVPDRGFTVDRSLIFALVRQESKFEPAARSQAGATGLMQLMPRTASYIASKGPSGLSLTELDDPEVNLSLGQDYVGYLLARPEVENNMLYMLAAYNSGPGQLAKWQRELTATRDPLLFIETLPAAETRNFIRCVLANYWIYQQQLDQPTASLDAVATGAWPYYLPQDVAPIRMADNATVH